jgi:hypothetical protein
MWSVISKLIGSLKDQLCVHFGEGKGDRPSVLYRWCELGIDRSGSAALIRGGLTSDKHWNPLSELAKRFIRTIIESVPSSLRKKYGDTLSW